MSTMLSRIQHATTRRVLILALLLLPAVCGALWLVFRDRSPGIDHGQPISVTEVEECIVCGLQRQRTVTSSEPSPAGWAEYATEASDWILALDDGTHDHSWMLSQVSAQYGSGKRSLACYRPDQMPRELARARQALDQDPRLMSLVRDWLAAWQEGEPDVEGFRARLARLQGG